MPREENVLLSFLIKNQFSATFFAANRQMNPGVP